MNLSTFVDVLSCIKMAAEDLNITGDIGCEHDEFYITFSHEIPEGSILANILEDEGFRREEDYLFVRYV